MSENDKPQGSGEGAGKAPSKAKRTRKTLVRKTRYLALEPRIVFDGALAADIVDKTAQTAADASKPAGAPATEVDKTLPAVDWTQTSTSAVDGKSAGASLSADKAVADALAPDRAAADKAAEAANKSLADRSLIGAFDSSAARTEIVFIDTSVNGYQALLQGINPSARVVVLDSTQDAVGQMASVLAKMPVDSVDAVHLIARGTAGELDFGTGVLSTATIDGAYATVSAPIEY